MDNFGSLTILNVFTMIKTLLFSIMIGMFLMHNPASANGPKSSRTNSTRILNGGKTAIHPDKILALMKRVADWQLANPTGKALNSWEYGPFYIGLMALYKTSSEQKYLDSIKSMGNHVRWEPVARPYDANVLAISQVFLEYYEMTGDLSMVDKSRFVMDAPMQRELKPDITFKNNRYWWEWWSWCDALFMAPPAYARMAAIFKEPKYMQFMVQEWKRTSKYLYDAKDSLFFRDDRFFTMKSDNGKKIFWSRGNGWVIAGLARIMEYLPKGDTSRLFFEHQFKEMSYRLKGLQMANGFWGQSLLDTENYPQKESSGTGFFVYALTWGVNNGLLPKTEFLPVIEKGWAALKASIHPNGKLGYVQEVGDAPTNVKFEDSETYGTGAFLLAGAELYKLFKPHLEATASILTLDDRTSALNLLFKIVDPVLIPLSQHKLHEVFPRKSWETRQSNVHTSILQAFGRSLSGMAPWLSLGADSSNEGKLRAKYIKLARTGLINATDPGSPDYMFNHPTQEIIVHAAYIAYPLLLAPDALWKPLSKIEKKSVIDALKLSRLFKPNESNWLLFPAIIESAILKFTGQCDMEKIDYALNKHMDWYLGDGVYGDGPDFHWDYYNSYVIHPLLLETLKTCVEMGRPLQKELAACIQRGLRYGEITEHFISPEGTFPVMGRSSVYRIAALQQLEYMAFRMKKLPASLRPGATRAAITAVIRNMMLAPGTFDENGWLNAGIVGKQINARDEYNYTGALYMCALGLSHLGIPPEEAFWTDPVSKWTQQRIWSGENLKDQTVFK